MTMSSWKELVQWAEYGESEQNGRDPDAIKALATQAEWEIRRNERQRVANEMLALREELKIVGRHSAAAVMHDMWQRVTRRLDK